MKIIIAGSRSITDLLVVEQAMLHCGFVPTAIVSGTVRGVDQLGEAWAQQNGVPVVQMPADWNRYGRSAGYKRNQQMAEYADALVAIWDGESKGTGHMINIMVEARKPTFTWNIARNAAPHGVRIMPDGGYQLELPGLTHSTKKESTK